ncbi:MAG: hypothetical protein ABUS49_12410 [Acidobacteriota bacterium]
MILPGSYIFTLALLILSMLCWGSWANTFKLSGKWRFELFYFDFAFGAFIAALIAALTFGSLGWDGFSFFDDIRNAGKRQDLFAFMAGAVFNLANMLLVAAVSLAGMSVAFPIGIGLALVIGVVWSYALHPVGSPVFLGLGSVAIAFAIILNAVAYKMYAASRQKRATQVAPAKAKKPAGASSGKGILIAVVSGILMGSFYPLVEMATNSEVGLGPYSIGVIFATGILFTTFVYNLFFMNLPVQGQPVDFSEYFKGNPKQHGLGILGGMLWTTSAVANFVAARAEGAAQAGPAVSYAMGQGATLISALWGLLVWKEFADADGKVKTMLFIMFVFFITGLIAVSVAPLFSGLR